MKSGTEGFLKDRITKKPVFLTGLQCHNSSAGTELMDRTLQAVKLYGGNLLEAPVYWCEVEPEEGIYDLSSVERLLQQAGDAGIYLIPLWFGASKNGMYTYAPEYVKRNPSVYRRVKDGRGRTTESLSAGCRATLERDKRAFEKVMEFLAKKDTRGTVIAVQVENEVGYVHTDRDYSDESEQEYRGDVPGYLSSVRIAECGTDDNGSGTWKERFGQYSAEAFSAWQQAVYIQEMIGAGKRKLDIPYLMNISIEVNEYEEPGHCYISGGPVARVLDIWKKTATSVTLFGPDIYVQAERDYRKACEKYARTDNPLFIPESCISGVGAGLNIMIAAADYNAIGICCFGAESAVEGGRLLPEAEEVAVSMRAVSALAPLLILNRGNGKVHAVTQAEFATWQHIMTEKYHILAHFLNQEKQKRGYFGSRINLYAEENRKHLERRGRCLIIEGHPDEFFVAGCGVCIEFRRRPDITEENVYEYFSSSMCTQAQFLSIEEGHFEGERWVCDYKRNGDEAYGPVYVHDGGAVRIRLDNTSDDPAEKRGTGDRQPD
ncbi:DUF5597 domain-containing protein [Lachnoclostridium sp. An169]|uniref:DUF5597 domain-containing protein n=1 Tax=Lachnoclostridium sp. An169 TaxID=1965569 RepID=UPI0013A683EB|nr:DUF5597 domain-containing protein [Lachnoclostridium sp. An169]